MVHDWFDNELKGVAGLDIRDLNFDPDKKWLVHRGGKFWLLVLRAEDSDETKLAALSEFLDTPITELVRENDASVKKYAELYGAFKKSVRLPKSYLDWMYDREFSSIFYTPTEVRRMRSAWAVSDELRFTPPDASGTPARPEYKGPVAVEAPPSEWIDAAGALDLEALPATVSAALQPLHADDEVIRDVESWWSVERDGFDVSVKLRLAFTAARTLQAPVLGLPVFTTGGVLATAFRAPDAVIGRALSPGRHAFVLEIPNLPLNTGTYLPVLSILENGAFAHRMPIKALRIESAAQRSEGGVVLAAHRWSEGLQNEGGKPARPPALARA